MYDLSPTPSLSLILYFYIYPYTGQINTTQYSAILQFLQFFLHILLDDTNDVGATPEEYGKLDTAIQGLSLSPISIYVVNNY